MSTLCEKPSKLLLLESAFRSFCSVITTHILAGQVDVQLEETETETETAEEAQATTPSCLQQQFPALLRRLWWFARYFNPLNLAWRYYSILAFRCHLRLRRHRLRRHHLALLNFECFPFTNPPIPFLLADSMFHSHLLCLKRLEPSGVFSAQGLLSCIAAYQALQAIQFTIASSGFGFLPNVTKAMAILGLFRVLVSPWIANRVHVEVSTQHPSRLVYLGDVATALSSLQEPGIEVPKRKNACLVLRMGGREQLRPPWLGTEAGMSMDTDDERPGGSCSKALAGAWAVVMVSLVGLSMRSYLPFPADYSEKVPSHLIDRSIELLYNYISLSSLGFHGCFLWQGARALGNRIPLFGHPLYHMQTALFLLLLLATLLIGIVDFVHHDFYSNCFY